MKSNHQCRVCGLWLEGLWNRLHSNPQTPREDLDEVQRQMDNGLCVKCEAICCHKCGRMTEWDGYAFICVNEVQGVH